MSTLQSIIFSAFAILVILNIFFVYAAAHNTVEGKRFLPHGFNIHKLFDESLYTDKGNMFRKYAIYCWMLELPLLVLWLIVIQ
jgi:hypothetical protein